MLGSYIVTQLCPLIYLLFNCAPWNPICDQQVALDVSQLWLGWRVDWFASGLALMFCYCYLHNAVQPLTAGLLLFFFLMCQHFYKVIFDFFLMTLFLPKAQFSKFPRLILKPQSSVWLQYWLLVVTTDEFALIHDYTLSCSSYLPRSRFQTLVYVV